MASDTETKGRINILFVSATVPYPAIDGGRIRVLNLISRLCRIHKVTLLTFVTSPVDEAGIRYLREMGVEVVEVRRPDTIRRIPDAEHWSRIWVIRHRVSRMLRSMLQVFIYGKPLTVAKYYSVEMTKALENLLKSRRFDIMHFEMLHAGQFLPHLRAESRVQSIRSGTQEVKQDGETFNLEPETLSAVSNGRSMPYATVLGEQNIDSSIWYRLAREELNLLRKLIFYSQYRSFLSYESRICRYFDLCVCVSTQDQRRLASLCPEAAVEVIPNGVDPDYFRQGEAAGGHAVSLSEEDGKRLVFTGSMDWHPNEDAVLYFCDHILPLIRAEIPEATFYIVGSNPTDRVLKLRGMQGVIVTGSVEDVRPYIVNADVYVVPLRIGGGTRLKILQALAMKKAVISTAVGCEGLDLQPGEHILVAEEPRQFAAEAIQLIRDGPLRRRLGENGRTLIQERYDWDVIVKKLDSIYRDLIVEVLQIDR